MSRGSTVEVSQGWGLLAIMRVFQPERKRLCIRAWFELCEICGHYKCPLVWTPKVGALWSDIVMCWLAWFVLYANACGLVSAENHFNI
jgi:hypothetical protein